MLIHVSLLFLSQLSSILFYRIMYMHVTSLQCKWHFDPFTLK